jgi:hypothetical protein
MGIACFCPAERVHYISEAKAIIGEPVSTKGVGIVNGTIAVLPKTATLKTIDIRLTQTLKTRSSLNRIVRSDYDVGIPWFSGAWRPCLWRPYWIIKNTFENADLNVERGSLPAIPKFGPDPKGLTNSDLQAILTEAGNVSAKALFFCVNRSPPL